MQELAPIGFQLIYEVHRFAIQQKARPFHCYLINVATCQDFCLLWQLVPPRYVCVAVL